MVATDRRGGSLADIVRRGKKTRNLPGQDKGFLPGWKDGWKFGVKGHEIFWKLHRALRGEILRRWHRGLPFNEELFDRWERARFLRFGEGASVYDSCIVLGDVKVGKNTWIGPFTVLDGSGGLEIGSYCAISAGVHIYTHNGVAWALTGGEASYEKAPVKIRNRCYIGPNATIAQGVAIGPCSVVAPNSFVEEDVGPRTIVAGNPARQIGNVVIKGKSALIVKKIRGSKA